MKVKVDKVGLNNYFNSVLGALFLMHLVIPDSFGRNRQCIFKEALHRLSRF